MTRPRTELLAETREVVVLRLHGEPRAGADDQQRGVVVYVPPGATATTIATQLRGVADRLDKAV